MHFCQVHYPTHLFLTRHGTLLSATDQLENTYATNIAAPPIRV